MHGSRVLIMGDGQGGKVALKLLGEMAGMNNLLVGVMVFNMPAMQKESFAKLPANIPMCMHLSTEQGTALPLSLKDAARARSKLGRRLKDLTADARGVGDAQRPPAMVASPMLLRARLCPPPLNFLMSAARCLAATRVIR